MGTRVCPGPGGMNDPVHHPGGKREGFRICVCTSTGCRRVVRPPVDGRLRGRVYAWGDGQAGGRPYVGTGEGREVGIRAN